MMEAIGDKAGVRPQYSRARNERGSTLPFLPRRLTPHPEASVEISPLTRSAKELSPAMRSAMRPHEYITVV